MIWSVQGEMKENRKVNGFSPFLPHNLPDSRSVPSASKGTAPWMVTHRTVASLVVINLEKGRMGRMAQIFVKISSRGRQMFPWSLCGMEGARQAPRCSPYVPGSLRSEVVAEVSGILLNDSTPTQRTLK